MFLLAIIPLALFSSATSRPLVDDPTPLDITMKDDDGNVVILGNRTGNELVKLRITPPTEPANDYYNTSELIAFLNNDKWAKEICELITEKNADSRFAIDTGLSEILPSDYIKAKLPCGVVLQVDEGPYPKYPVLKVCPYSQEECEIFKDGKPISGSHNLPVVSISPLEAGGQLEEMWKTLDTEPLFYAVVCYKPKEVVGKTDCEGITLCYEPTRHSQSSSPNCTARDGLNWIRFKIFSLNSGDPNAVIVVNNVGVKGNRAVLNVSRDHCVMVPFGDGRHQRDIYSLDDARDEFVPTGEMVSRENTSVKVGPIVGIWANSAGDCPMEVKLVGSRIQNCYSHSRPILSCPNTNGLDVLTCTTKVIVGTVRLQQEENGTSTTDSDSQKATDGTNTKIGGCISAGGTIPVIGLNLGANIYSEHGWYEGRERTVIDETVRYAKLMSSVSELKTVEVNYELKTPPGMYQVLLQRYYTCRGRTEATPLMQLETHKDGKFWKVEETLGASVGRAGAGSRATPAKFALAATSTHIDTGNSFDREENDVQPTFDQDEQFSKCCAEAGLPNAEKVCRYRELLSTIFTMRLETRNYYPALEAGIPIASDNLNATVVNEAWAKFLTCLNNSKDNRRCCYANRNLRGLFFKRECTPLCDGKVLASDLDVYGMNAYKCPSHWTTAVLCAIKAG